MRELINIFESIEQIYTYFMLNSINAYNFKILSQLIKDILNNPQINKEQICKIIKSFISFFENEKNLLEQNIKIETSNKELIRILNELIDEVRIIFNNKNNIFEIYFYEIQINKIKNLNYIQNIVSLIFNKEEFIQKSEIFIKYFLPKEELIPSNSEKNSFMKIFKDLDPNIQTPKLILFELNKKESNVFDETILFYFNKILKDYFIKLEEDSNNNNKDSKNNIYDKLSYEYFIICLNLLQEILSTGICTISKLTNFVKLYSISYITNYLNNYARILFDDNLYNKYTFDSLNDFLNNSDIKNNFLTIIKIYIFKLIYNKFDRNFELFIEFMNYNVHNKNLKYFQKYDLGQNKKNYNNYLLLNLDMIQRYENFLVGYFEDKKHDFKIENSKLISIIKESYEDNNEFLDIFYCLVANNILNQYIGVDNIDFINSSLFDYANKIKEKIFDNNTYNFIQKELLNLIINPDLFFNKIIIKYGILDSKKFDIITYSFRFLLSINSNINFYSNFFYDNVKDFIQTNYFPGTYMETDLFIRTLPDIEKHLSQGPKNRGCYVCSCGFYYPIPPCGFPTSESDCIVCKKRIGGTQHKMIKRPGHLRIYKNIEDLNSYGGYNGGQNFRDLSGNVMTLEEYKQKIINKRPPLDYKGIKKEKLSNFKNTLLIRNINILTYRIMHFILYSHLFFSNALNYLTDPELGDYCVEGLNCLEILEFDWAFIEKDLKENGISKIHVFFNYIFKDFIKNMKKSNKEMKDIETRNNFEKSIFNFFNTIIQKEKYKQYEESYLNKNIKPIGDLMIKNIIEEILKPSNYSEVEFPYLKYFYFSKTLNKKEIYEKLKTEKDYTTKYPLLDTCLSNEGLNKIKLLQNLQNINNFSNFLLKKYSYEITREKAKSLKIKEVLNNKKLENLFEKYSKSWDNIKSYATKYECRNEMEILNINKDSYLSEFLLDNGELYHGMYLAAAYDMFIEWQNSIISNIINVNSQNGLLKSYIQLLKRKVYVQEANENDILSISKFIDNKVIDDIIFKYVYRNCFEKDKNGKLEIDYYNYDSFSFDFEKMEIELGKILLIGKKQFITKEEDKNYLNFVTYRFEGFRNNKSSIIIEFREKYESKELIQQEKDDILRYLNSQNIINISNMKIKKMKELENIYFSLQTLLFYIYKENFEIIKPINDIINELPEYICICEQLKNFFNIYQNFGINSILKIFENIESLCFEVIRQNLNEEYKKVIKNPFQNQIKNYINNNKNGIILIAKNFPDALRKLISRYLAGKRSDMEIDEKKELKYYVAQEDLWENDPSRDEQLQNALDEFFINFQLTVGQCLALYDLLHT